MQRQKLPQELLTQKLKYLKPNAAINVRPYANNEHLAKNPIIMGEYLIDWDDSQGECPSLNDINAITDQQISYGEYEQRLESQRRDNIVDQLRLDYGMQAAYAAYLSSNPLETFEFEGFARIAVDAVEDAKQEKSDNK